MEVVPVDDEDYHEFERLVSGGISGAITNPLSKEALAHADRYYEFICHNRSDVARIAENTGYPAEIIQTIKNYLFIDSHDLEDGYHPFDPCFEIAESWQRLSFDFKYVKPHDFTLIKHEIEEMRLVEKGYDQQSAHDLTEKTYNYEQESREYYKHLKPRHNNAEIGEFVGVDKSNNRDDER